MIGVLHYIESDSISGITRLVLNLAQEQRHNPNLRVGLLVGRQRGELIPRFEALGAQITVANIRGGYHFPLWRIPRLVATMRRYSVVHLHSYSHFMFVCAALSRRPVVYTVHSLMGAPGRKAKPLDFIKRAIMGCFFRNFVTQMVYNSQFTQQQTTSHYRLKRGRHAVVYNGIPPVKHQPSYNTSNVFTVGCVGNLVPLKRVHLAIEAFALAQLPNARLLVVGNGSERNTLEKLALRLGVHEQVEFVGKTAEVERYYQQFSMLVSASVHETFGLVAIEAYSFGIPVVVMSNGGGIAELVGGIEPQNIVANSAGMAQRIKHYFNNTNEIEQTRSLRCQYASRFSSQQMEEAVYGLYYELTK